MKKEQEDEFGEDSDDHMQDSSKFGEGLAKSSGAGAKGEPDVPVPPARGRGRGRAKGRGQGRGEASTRAQARAADFEVLKLANEWKMQAMYEVEKNR